MVEVLEYTLVFAITALVAGFSVVVVQGSLPVIKQTEGSAELDELSGAATTAVVEGSATIALPLTNASLSCSSGTLSLTLQGLNYTSKIGYQCSFALPHLTCLCTVVFTRGYDGLEVRVSD